MPCNIQINKNLVNKVQLMSNDALSKPLIEANKIADDINKKFQTPVVSFVKTSSGKLERSIFIPQSLVDTYYKHELSIEKIEPVKFIPEIKIENISVNDTKKINTSFSTLDLDMNNLNLTPDVVNYLYGESSNRLSKESFAIQSKELISILQGSNLTNQEILEKLKCL